MWRESIFWLLSLRTLYPADRLISGSRLLLDMKPYVDKYGSAPLQIQGLEQCRNNGIFVRFGDDDEHDEILSMAEREHLNWQ